MRPIICCAIARAACCERVKRLGLRPDRLAGLRLAERADGVAHGAVGARHRRRKIAALLAQLLHHVAQHLSQHLLLIGVVLVLVALLAALLRAAEAAVEQLLLALHHVLHLPHRLVLAALHLSRLRHAQVLEHLLELRQQVLRLRRASRCGRGRGRGRACAANPAGVSMREGSIGCIAGLAAGRCICCASAWR